MMAVVMGNLEKKANNKKNPAPVDPAKAASTPAPAKPADAAPV